MLKSRLREGDDVILIAGADKGRVSRIKRVLRNKSTGRVRLIVHDVHLAKRHRRGNPNLNKKSTIESIEKPFDSSNVAIYNRKTGRADRVGFKLENGKKVRIFKSDRTVIVGSEE